MERNKSFNNLKELSLTSKIKKKVNIIRKQSNKSIYERLYEQNSSRNKNIKIYKTEIESDKFDLYKKISKFKTNNDNNEE